MSLLPSQRRCFKGRGAGVDEKIFWTLFDAETEKKFKNFDGKTPENIRSRKTGTENWKIKKQEKP